MHGIPSRRRLVAAVSIVAISLAAYLLLEHYVLPGLLFLRDVREEPAVPPAAGPQERDAWTEADVRVDRAEGPLRIRTYRPRITRGRPLLLVHGVQSDGIDGDRMRRFARKLAELGHPVVTPEIPDLTRAELETRSIDEIEAGILWTLDESGLVPPGESIGLMGASIGGGYAVATAGRERIRDRIAYVASFGGHADLRWLVEFLVTGRLADGTPRDPHAYAVAVLLHAFAEHCVPPEQVAATKDFLAAYLRDDEPAARARLATLVPPAREYARLCLERRGLELGRAIASGLRSAPIPPSISPMTTAPPRCPVFLLHGSADDLIPPDHSTRLAARLGPATTTRVLVTPLVGHADFGGMDWWDLLHLAAFITEILRI